MAKARAACAAPSLYDLFLRRMEDDNGFLDAEGGDFFRFGLGVLDIFSGSSFWVSAVVLGSVSVSLISFVMLLQP